MLDRLREHFVGRSLKRSIKLAIEAIYSEQFDMDAVTRRLASTNDLGQLLRAYIAIQIATQLTDPLNQADIDHALKELRSSEHHLDQPDFQEILALRKELAEVCWLQKTNEILERKLALQNNPYSYDAAIYRLEKAGKGPTTPQEREKYRKLAEEIEDSEKKLDAYLDKKASEEAFDKWLQKTIAEVEAEKK